MIICRGISPEKERSVERISEQEVETNSVVSACAVTRTRSTAMCTSHSCAGRLDGQIRHSCACIDRYVARCDRHPGDRGRPLRDAMHASRRREGAIVILRQPETPRDSSRQCVHSMRARHGSSRHEGARCCERTVSARRSCRTSASRACAY